MLSQASLVPLSIINTIADEFGFVVCGYLPEKVVTQSLSADVIALANWQDSGFAGQMEYMKRRPELFTELRTFLPEVRSVLTLLVSYNLRPQPHTQHSGAPKGYGRVARYAWGRDYHRVLKKLLKEFLSSVEERTGSGPITYRIFTDAVPLLERALGRESKLGFVGKNTLLIRPGIGSFTFIAELLWDLQCEMDLEDLKPSSEQSGCGSCQRCIERCPTQAIVHPHRLDARRCISYLTIEKRGPLTDWERTALGDWVFGCDICQDVCPYNHRGVQPGKIQEFSPENGEGEFLDLRRLLKIGSVEEFRAKFQGTAIMRAGRERLLRNAISVSINSNFDDIVPELRLLTQNDPSVTLRMAAEQALRHFS